MKVAEMIAARRDDWRVLEHDVSWLRAARGRRLDAERVAAFARRYRAACSDLALATALRFPATTVEYLQQLVADAHTQLYRIESFSVLEWLRGLLVEVPRRTARDPCTWIAAAVFWLGFLGALGGALVRPRFAADVLGAPALERLESMYAEPLRAGPFSEERSVMAGFYVFNNAGIGLRCFAGGILCGIGSLVVMAFNAVFLGAAFGHMLAAPGAANFTEFVTAHAPCELTAIALSGGAGLRLGWSLLDTRGWARQESLRRSAPQALGTVGLATVLFFVAAFIEGFVSPAPLPYAVKAGVALSTGLGLVLLFALPGTIRGGGDVDAA